MITLSIDRRAEQQGLEVSGHTEFSLLISYLNTLSIMLPRCTIIKPGTMRERIQLCNKVFYFCNIELRLKNNYTSGHGASILYKDDTASKNIAEFLYDSILGVQFEHAPSIAYYHGDESKGYDFFVEHCEQAAIIIYIDYAENVESIRMGETVFCSKLAQALNNLL